MCSRVLHLSPLAGRGRRAPARRVRGSGLSRRAGDHRSHRACGGPSPRPLPASGERERRRRRCPHLGLLGGFRRAHGGRHFPQQEAHLQLRRARRPCDGGRAHRRGPHRRLSRGRRLRPHHQPDDAARPGDRLAGPRPRRRHAGGPPLRRRRPVPDRLARRLSAPHRQRLPQPARRDDRTISLPHQPARRQRRRRRRDYFGRRHHGQRGRQRAARFRRGAAGTAADAAADLGDGGGGLRHKSF